MVHPVERCGFGRTYVVSCPEGLLVVDVGSVAAARETILFVEGVLGSPPSQVRYVLATHFHVDHIGGIGHLLDRCGDGTRVLFHRAVRDYLEGVRPIPVMKNWIKGLLPVTRRTVTRVRRLSELFVESPAGIPLPLLRHWSALPFEREKIVFAHEGFPLGLGDWEVLETPGHTSDSLSLYSRGEGVLICGDLIHNVFDDGRGRLNGFYEDRDEIVKTYEALAMTLRVDRIYPGHGEVILGEGDALAGVVPL